MCKQCGQCFNQPGSLQRHRIVHTGVKSLTYKQSAKDFSQADTLLHHESLQARGKSEQLEAQKLTHCRPVSVSESDGNSLTDTSSLQVPSQTDQDETYSCWICQEELSCHALLVEHYDNHMK